MTTTITITKRTDRNTCYTIVEPNRNGGRPRKDYLLHDAFNAWIARNPQIVVTDNTK